MTSRKVLLVGAFLALAALMGSCGDDQAGSYGADRVIHVDDATVVLPAGANSAAYLTVRNDGPDSDRLVEVRTAAASSTELHETRSDDDGLLRMYRLESVDLPAGETVRLAPGGLHVMLFDAERLDAGAEVDLELVFEHGDPQTIAATVRSSAELVG